MPLGLNDIFEKCKVPFASDGITNLFRSVWTTAGLMTVLIILLIMIIYPGRPGTSLKVVFTLFIYIYIVICGSLYLHDCIVKKSEEAVSGGAANMQFINGLHGDDNIAFAGDKIEVLPYVGDNKPAPTVDSSLDDDFKGGNHKAEISNGDLFAMYGV